MIGGASAGFAVSDWAYDFWRYTHAGGWVKMPTSYPGAEADRAIQRGAYTGNLIHHPPSNSLYYFMSARKIHRFDLGSGQWSTTSDAPGYATIQEVGAHGLFDPERNRFAFYGNNWHATDAATNEFVFFNVATNSWVGQPVPSSGPGQKSYAALEYNSKWKVYMLHGAWRDNETWVYDPATTQWHQVRTPSTPPAATGRGTYTAYDAFNDALIKFDEATGRLYAFRWRPGL